MQAGRLNNRVTLQRRVDGQDASGGIEPTYVDFLPLWASIEPLTARELAVAAQQAMGEVETRIRVRYTPQANAKMRVVFERVSESPAIVEVYDVQGVTHPRERNIETWLWCKRRDTDGFRGA